MSDDKDKKDPPKGDGTGPASGTDNTGTGTSATTVPFSELMGQIDSRIESAVRNVLGKGGGDTGTKTAAGTASETPESVAQQVRNELAKLNGEEAAKQKEASRDVTIAELQQTVTKLSEAAPVQTVSKLTQFMWGGKKKTG